MKKSKVIYVDMDDTIADFYSSAKNHHGQVEEGRMWTPSFFLNLSPTPGSQNAIHQLEKLGYDIWVLTQPLAGHPESYSDKAHWIQKHFPSLFKKLVMTQDKGLHLGNFLIDDNRKWREKFENNGGTFIHFPYGGYNQDQQYEAPEKLWILIVDQLKRHGETDDQS